MGTKPVRMNWSFALLLILLTVSCKSHSDIEEISIVNPYKKYRLIKETYKTYNNISKIDSETISVNGTRYPITVESITNYRYNENNRLIAEQKISNIPSEIPLFEETYAYSINKIFINTKYKNSENTVRRIDTLHLDERQLSIYQLGNLKATYNQDKYLTKLSSETNSYYIYTYDIVDKNIVKTTYPNITDYGKSSDSYVYDLSRMNTPNNKPFLGEKSRNLPLKMTHKIEGSMMYQVGDAYILNFQYTFDNNELVKRMVRIGTAVNQSWPFIFDRGSIGVFDYEYEAF